MKFGRTILMAMIVLALTPVAFGGGVVRLQAKATVEDTAVRLGDIATLSGMGKDAEKLAEIVIVETLPKDGARVKAEQVLFAIASVRGTQASADLQISGSAECVVTHKGDAAVLPIRTEADGGVGTTVVGETPKASSNRTIATTDSPQSTPATTQITPKGVPAANTLGQLITQRVSSDLEIPTGELRVDFDTISPWLDSPVTAGQRWQFRSLSRSLGTVQWDAQLMEGTKVVARQMVMAKVTRRQTVVTATGTIGRGDIIAAKDLKEEEVWMDCKLPTLAAKISDVAGLEALRPITAGSQLDTRDVKAAEMAGRGDAVTVYAVSGNLVIKGTARAMENGKLHDSIRVRNDATSDTYQVTLIGKRVATVGPAVDAETEQKLKEMQ